MSDLPEPLTPADCDLRGEPLPFALVEAAAKSFGRSVEEVLQVMQDAGIPVETRA